MKTCTRIVTAFLLTVGVLTAAGAVYGTEPVTVTVLRWPYT